MTYIDISPENRVYYREFGKGKDVILIPSLWLTSTSYTLLGQELGKHYHVMVPDLFRGRSKFSEKPSRHDDYVEGLHQFVHAMNLKDYFLIGVSLSGMTALKYILKSDLLPRKLFLVSTSMVPLVDPFDIKKQRRILAEGYMKLLFGNLNSRNGIRWNAKWITDWIENAVRHPSSAIKEGLIAISVRVPEISSLPVPAKLLFAESDEFIPHDVVKRMRGMGNLDVQEVKGHHAWFFGHEGELAAEINKYFSED